MKMNSESESEVLDPELKGFYQSIVEDGRLKKLQMLLHLIIKRDGTLVYATGQGPNKKIARELIDHSKYIGIKGLYSDDNSDLSLMITGPEKFHRFSQYVDAKIQKAKSATKLAFATKEKVKWRCPECGYCMAVFENPDDLEDLLLSETDVRPCRKCRKLSGIWIYDGRIRITRVITDDRKAHNEYMQSRRLQNRKR